MKVRFAVAPGLAAFDADAMATFITQAETLGFDTIWLSDVPLGPIGDPLVTLTYAAACTTKLKLGANVVPIGRNPLLLARELAQIDRLSHGRLLVSFVPGIGQPDERRLLGFATGDRGALMEQMMGQLRGWWRGEQVDGVQVTPTPVQQPLEIWLGGTGPVALARAGRCSDGWLTANSTPEEAGNGRAAIQAAAAKAGRTIDVEHFGISMPFARTALSAPAVAAMQARRGDRPVDDIGELAPVGAAALRGLLGRHIEQGLSKFVLRPMDGAPLEWLADAVLPLQT